MCAYCTETEMKIGVDKCKICDNGFYRHATSLKCANCGNDNICDIIKYSCCSSFYCVGCINQISTKDRSWCPHCGKNVQLNDIMMQLFTRSVFCDVCGQLVDLQKSYVRSEGQSYICIECSNP